MLVKVFKLSFAVSKCLSPAANHPGVEPSAGGLYILETLDGFKSAV